MFMERATSFIFRLERYHYDDSPESLVASLSLGRRLTDAGCHRDASKRLTLPRANHSCLLDKPLQIHGSVCTGNAAFSHCLLSRASTRPSARSSRERTETSAHYSRHYWLGSFENEALFAFVREFLRS